MDIKQTKATLGKAIILAKMVRMEIESAVNQSQMPKAEELHDLKDMILILGNDVATADSYLGTYKRLGFGSERFITSGKQK